MKSKRQYRVKELFYTLQGEGANAGRPAVFCRFSGCNLWSGREEERTKAICKFCDTDFIGTDGFEGGVFQSAPELAEKIEQVWRLKLSPKLQLPKSPQEGEIFPQNKRTPSPNQKPMVVFTGGEPLLQLDEPLLRELHRRDFFIAVESNGTIEPPPGIDWLCISPKAGAPFKVKSGNELKLVFPQPDLPPESLEGFEFEYFFIQPMDGPELQKNIQLAVEYCLKNPHWRLSLQIHKILDLP